jgi:hypothetical protein
MNIKQGLSLIIGLLLSCQTMAASGTEILGTFDDWTAYVFSDNGGKVCYMATEPTKSEGKYKVRDDVFLFVTHRMADKTFDTVNVMAGYTYKTSSKPTFKVDGKKAFTLVSHADTAWTKDAKTDKALVDQMRAGSKAVLKGTSRRGTLTTDTFSLKGFSKAYRAIQKACGRE